MTLYELFGVHADAGEETLRWAFRRALAANPAGPDAGADPLFRSIVASGILKDSKQLALYERLLARERVRLQANSRRLTFSSIVAACLTIVAGTIAAEYSVLATLENGAAAIVAAPDGDTSLAIAAAPPVRDNADRTAVTPAMISDTPRGYVAKGDTDTVTVAADGKEADTRSEEIKSDIATAGARKEADAPPATAAASDAGAGTGAAGTKQDTDTTLGIATARSDSTTPAAAAPNKDATVPPGSAKGDNGSTVIAAAPRKDANTASATGAAQSGDGASAAAPRREPDPWLAPAAVTSDSGQTTTQQATSADAAKKETDPAAATADPIKGELGAKIAAALVQNEANSTASRNGEPATVAVATSKNDSPLTSPRATPETVAVQPPARTELQGTDGMNDRLKKVDIPEAAVEEGAATNSGTKPILGFLSANTRVLNDSKFYRRRSIISYKRGALQQALSNLDEAGALEMTKDKSVPEQARQTVDVGGRDGRSGIAITQPSAAATAGRSRKSQGAQPADGHEAQSADAAFSVPGRHDLATNSSSSGDTVFGDKRGNKSPEPGGGNTDDGKASEIKVRDIKVSARPLTAVKRQTARRPSFNQQALLEGRNTSDCTGSQSCSRSVPGPLFGVGP